MRISVLKNVFAALALVLLHVPAKAAVLESFAVRDWSLFAYSDDKTSQFSHCAMIANYRNGISLIFSIDAQKNWFMGLSNPKWALKPENKYHFGVGLDNETATLWVGVAVTIETLIVPLPNSPELVERVSRSATMTIKAASGESFKFDLANSRVALEAVASCTARHTAGNLTVNAPVPPSLKPNLKADPSRVMVR